MKPEPSRANLTRGLAAAARTHHDELLALGEKIAQHHRVRLVAVPAAQSVLIELTGPIGAAALGEAVVTTSTVDVDGKPGWGCVLGWDDAGSLAAALCEAVAGLPGHEDVRELATAAVTAEESAARSRADAVGKTRVGTT